MSLDVSLYGPAEDTECSECGHGRPVRPLIYDANITHNLTSMADEAGIYQYLWRPEELKINTAVDLIEPLKKGLALLKSDPERFIKLNPSNGWGSYDSFVPWVENYLKACEENPTATISVSR